MGTEGNSAGTTSRQGIVLVVVVSLLAALAMLCVALFAILTVDIRSAGYYDRAVSALHDADGGAEYVFSRVRQNLASATLILDSPSEAVNYAAPGGLNFDAVTNLVRLSDRHTYMYTVTGRSGSSRALIEVVLGLVVGDGRTSLLGAFGDDKFTIKPNSYVYSYHSSTNPNPSSSAGGATIGANKELSADDDAVDDSIYLGEAEDGTPATFGNEGSTSADVYRGDRINPDPLGVTTGGPLAHAFADAAVSNDNAGGVGGILNGNVLTIKGDVTLVAGDYYVDEIDLGAHEMLTIDATAGAVNIHLTGAMEMKPNSDLVVNPRVPSNFRVFSNSSTQVKLYPKTDFVGMIYAPLAPILVQPNGDFCGAIWGNELELKPGGETYLDLDSLDTWYFALGLVEAHIASWKHLE